MSLWHLRSDPGGLLARQVKCLVSLIRAAQLQGSDLLVAYLDFQDAFHSIDVTSLGLSEEFAGIQSSRH